MSSEKNYPHLNASQPMECISRKITRCNRIISNVFRKHLSQVAITNSQMSILFVIAKKKIVSQKEIATMLALEKSSLSRNLNRLLAANVIIYTNTKKLSMTEKGLEKLEIAIPHWEKAMKEIRSRLQENGELALNTLLQQLT